MDWSAIILKIFLFLVQLVILVFYIVSAIRNRQYFKEYWKPGPFLGTVIFLLLLPNLVLTLVYFDPAAYYKSTGGVGEPPEYLKFGLMIGFAIGIIWQVLRIGWNMVLYVVAAAEWKKLGQQTFQIFEQGKLLWKPILASFVFGIIAGLASTMIFYCLGIKEGEIITQMKQFFPNIDEVGLWIRIPLFSFFVVSAAIAEELVFRGGFLAFIVNKCSNKPLLMSFFIMLLSLIWALMHIPNTSAPLLKVLQIFFLGLIFSEFARRYGVKTAIAGHVGLNVGSVALGFALVSIN